MRTKGKLWRNKIPSIILGQAKEGTITRLSPYSKLGGGFYAEAWLLGQASLSGYHSLAILVGSLCKSLVKTQTDDDDPKARQGTESDLYDEASSDIPTP